MAKAYIYGLVSSGNPDVIKYVGVSINPRVRLIGHKAVLKSDAKFESNPHKGRWIRNMYQEGFELQYVILAEFETEEEAYSKEQEYINSYTSLTNIAPGGRGGCSLARDQLKILLAKAQKEKDYLGKGARTRGTKEFKEAARLRGLKQFESEEEKQLQSDRSKRGWAKRSAENRIPWNKGLRSSNRKDYLVTGYRKGSEELKQHSAEKSREYYAKLKEDPELYKKHMDARSEVPEKVSKKNKANWDALSEEERKLRGLKMSLGKKYSKAKKNNWVLDLSPKPCPRCGE